MLKCLIIDDEQSCIDTLRIMLEKKFAETVYIAGTTTNPKEAQALISIHKPDLVFLDVEMPHVTGTELLQSLSNIDFQVIFTTAHQHYALQAIKLNALDYLLKPISLEELATAIQKCASRKQQGASLISDFLEQMRAGAAGTRKISIASDNTVQFVPVTDIIRIESQSNYSNIHFTSRNKLLVAKTLKEFEEQLVPCNFLRIHHSHLINLEHVIGYKNLDGGYVIMRDNDIIEISRRKKQEVMQRLNSL
jgi:two-component system LytT family response regulator